MSMGKFHAEDLWGGFYSKVSLSAAQSIASGSTPSVVAFDSDSSGTEFDNFNRFDTSNNEWTTPIDQALYFVYAFVELDSITDTAELKVDLYIDGSFQDHLGRVQGATTGKIGAGGLWVGQVGEGGKMDIRAAQTTGGSQNITDNSYAAFGMLSKGKHY